MSFHGPAAEQVFALEGGGHRWQRIPPTERRGRVQTSTVTVAVLPLGRAGGPALREQDVDVATARGSGPGGQNRNKTESCVIATHRPTGLQVRIDNERSQHQNRRMALEILQARLTEADLERRQLQNNAERRGQIGRGERGDKVRTYRVRDDQVCDHRSGRKWRLAAWMRGEW